MDCHIHITVGTGNCKHIKFAVHRSSDDAYLGEIVITRADLEHEMSEYGTARSRIEAQLVGLALANKGRTPAQLKSIIEAAVIRV